jgi:hypothetical protein
MCYKSATFLSYKPCTDLASCTQTASLVCTISGADGCTVDVLATHILAYSKSIDKLNSAYAKFSFAYSSMSHATAASSLSSMSEAFDSMKAAGEEVGQTKLRYPETTACRDCLGICPEPKLDFGAIAAGKERIVSLQAKTAPLATLDSTIDKVYVSTGSRIKYRAGEEKAAVFAPRYDTLKLRFGSLKAQAVEAKALVSDASFVSAADSFLNKGDDIELRLEKRDFEGFDALLSGYEAAGNNLTALLNNSTKPYTVALAAQDEAGDRLLVAQWRVNRLSPSSVEAYNALAKKKNDLDAAFKPPMTSAQYSSLTSQYNGLSLNANDYIAASASTQESVFGVGNAFSRASVDGAMGLVNSMVPVSFKTRQSLAKFVPPLVMGAIDLFLLAIVMLAFAGVFLHFRGLFHNRLAISGWLLTLLAFMLVLIIGSVGFYSIVVSTEKFGSFNDFMGVLAPSPKAAVVVDETGAGDASAAMRECAGSIEAQLRSMGKATYKYYIAGSRCTSVIPKPIGNATNSTNATAYETKSNLAADDCLNNMPDVPLFYLKYANATEQPAFTTVVTKQALVKGNADYYGKKPMCDIANVLS